MAQNEKKMATFKGGGPKNTCQAILLFFSRCLGRRQDMLVDVNVSHKTSLE